MLNGIVGLLLAAGHGRRFDPAGQADKLLQALPDGTLVAQQSARRLRTACSSAIAVVGPASSDALRQVLAGEGCAVVTCAASADGMGHSLACGAQTATDQAADGLIIALADMPFVTAATVDALVQALRSGAGIAVPAMAGRRGNPVGFASRHFSQLAQMRGDTGAKALLKAHPIHEVTVDDTGIFRDIDTLGDLPGRA